MRKIATGIAARSQHPGAAQFSSAVVQRSSPSNNNNNNNSGSGSSSRDAGTLWKLFCSYATDQANQVTDAFLSAGYTMDTAPGAIMTAIKNLGLDLPAHGKGGTDSGTQGDFKEAAVAWVKALNGWASSHPAGTSGKGSKGLIFSETKQKEVEVQKVETKTKVDNKKHSNWHAENGEVQNAQGSMCGQCRLRWSRK